LNLLRWPVPLTERSATTVSILLLLGLDGLGEELGWRGFLLPRQLKHLDRLAASCLLGVVLGGLAPASPVLDRGCRPNRGLTW
jgi:hypothetical protein